ncbi:MAG: HAMP domain-containing histidine kinase [Lachnospiraceae bacterium]|nr:HAMP domain-containing histidine kinase [Lachnospiraceae bacterium]
MSNNKSHFEKPELSVEELSHALYEVNLKLQEANQKLIAQEKKRLEFYANISHDLRAPITALSNSIEYMLSKQQLSHEEMLDTLSIMQKRTRYMEHLINDIFLLSSLDSSDSKVHKEQVDMRFLLEDYFYLCEADTRYENAKLTLELPDDLQLTMYVDPALIQRVLDNLFTNALKYSKGTPDITLGSYVEKNEFIIYVQDHGVGIAKKHLSKIFDRSYMIEKSRTPDSESSSGFGLSIVKSIVEHHNGTVTCESELEKGSRFIIRLPL